MTTNFTQNVYNLGHLAGRHSYDAYRTISASCPSLPDAFSVFDRLWEGAESGRDASAMVRHLADAVLTLPTQYRSWWVNLVAEDPVHVIIETVLIAFVVYLLVGRRFMSLRKGNREKLTDAERKELLREWKETGRAGLVPASTSAPSLGRQTRVGTGVVVEKVAGSKMTLRLPSRMAGEPRSISQAGLSSGKDGQGERKTVLNFATHDFLGMASSDDEASRAVAATAASSPSSSVASAAAAALANRRSRKIKFADDDQLAEASVADASAAASTNSTDAVSNKKDGAAVAAAAATASQDSSSTGTTAAPASVKGAARAALSRYGCGSCGPRGFYGTIDAHLDLEETISEHMRTEQAIMYSDGASAATSTVAAFAKRGDLLIVDEAIYEALNTGVTLSRANVVYFRHNDVEDLRRVLERVRETDRRLKRNSADQRRFIVVEGLYKNRGTVPPLDEIAKIKAEFCYRLIIDESFSVGTLGPSGKGAMEHFGLTPMVDAEIIILGMENSIGSIGGVCVGNEEVVDHQRLSGAGYCFSASAPPFVASAAIASLGRIRNNPQLIERVRANRDFMYRTLRGTGTKGLIPDRLTITSDDRSVMIFLELSGQEADAPVERQIAIFDEIRDRCLRNGVALVSTGGHVKGHMHRIPPPALRLTVSAVHTEEEIRKAVQVLREAAVHTFGK